MNIYNKLILSFFTLLVSLNVGQSQTLGDRLNSYVEYLSENNDISMIIDVTMKDEKDVILETSKMEYFKSEKQLSTRMEERVFLFDYSNGLSLNIDNEAESLSVGEATSSNVVSTQLKSLIRMFDEGKDLFEIRDAMNCDEYQFEVFVQSEIFASYTFNDNNQLVEVIFYKTNPQRFEGEMINPKLFMTFSYDKKVEIAGISRYLHKREGRWFPLPKYKGFDFHDGLSYDSNE